jgi:uncharacterized protein (TIGR03435 family)
MQSIRTFTGVAILSLAIAAPASAQQPVTSPPQFEVATIKPSSSGMPGHGMAWEARRFHARNESMSQMMQFAWNIQQKQILNEPSWFETEMYDLEGQADSGEPTPAEWRLMVQRLLLDRLQMHTHAEKVIMPAYVLSVAKDGPKFPAPDAELAQGFKDVVRIQRRPHMWMRLIAVRGSMAQLAAELQRIEVDRPVVNRTGLDGRYTFTMTATSIKPFFENEQPSTGEDAPPELFTALREQLGLRLEPEKTAVDCLYLDRVSKPVVD